MPFEKEIDSFLDVLVGRKRKRHFFPRLLITLFVSAFLFWGYHYWTEEGQIFDFSDPTVVSFEVDRQKFFVKFQEEQAACAALGIMKYQFISINNVAFINKGLTNIRILKKTSEQPRNCRWLSTLEGVRLTPQEMRKYAR